MKSMDVAATNKEMETKGPEMVTFWLFSLLHANLFTLYARSSTLEFHESISFVSCFRLVLF